MNKPYVKKFDSNGKLLNPIIGQYLHQFPSVRGKSFTKRKHNNRKGV